MAATPSVPVTRRAMDPGISRPLNPYEIVQGSVAESVQLIPSASRTATNYSDRQDNLLSRGVIADISVTTPGTGSVTLSIQRWNPATMTWVDMLATAAIITATTGTLTLFPGAAITANVSANGSLPRGWRVAVTHNNANAITYSVGISTLP